jgi:predicted nucleic acid-binding protein
MPKAIIADTSCIILLDKIGELNLLHKLFGTIITTADVAKEFGPPLPEWVDIIEPHDKNYQSIIENTLDRGEASAIALALELPDSLLIIDELKGRKFAIQLGIKITGTIGIIVEAKNAGIINAVKPLITKIKKTNFRISEELEKQILDKAGE